MGDDFAECTNDLAEYTNKVSAGISARATWKDDESQNRLFWSFKHVGISTKSGIDDLNGFKRGCTMSMVQTTVGATWDVAASKKRSMEHQEHESVDLLGGLLVGS